MPISDRFRQALAAGSTAEQAVVLVTITHAEFGGPIRWCDGGANVVSQGRTFVARGIEPVPPGEGQDARAQSASLRIDNVEQDAVAALRSIQTGRPSVMFEVVLAATPDVIERRWSGLKITATRPSAGGIECDLKPRDDGEEEFPLQGFTPGRTPGLF